MSKSPNPSPGRSSPLSARDLLERLGCNSLDASSTGYAEFQPDLDEDLTACLRERFEALNHPTRFAPGMAVRWKPGLPNRRWPQYNQSAIVVEVLSEPILDSSEQPGSPYFREPLDLVIGHFVDKGEARSDFLTFYVDSRRFQPWSAEPWPEA